MSVHASQIPTQPMATCPNDGAPLIATMVFPKAEFYCLECGARLGFLSPRPAQATPELVARQAALQAEWDEHAGPKLRVISAWWDDCEPCKPHREYHSAHASPGEWEAQLEAVRWLAERAGRG